MERPNHNGLGAMPGYTPGGFRLQQLEVYNWGTFDGRVWRISPNGGTSLLTGANGSGKSTLADAFLTLFVPYQRRTYNQASGTEKHRERNEGTYVRGAWSKQKESDSQNASVQYLRDKNSYSVLLAVFYNAVLNQYVTLAQVFWWQQGELRKFFVVSNKPLSIAEHFIVSGDMASLRKQLRTSGAETFEEFAKYSRRFCLLLGLRSEKALDLFNQIVSIKDIGGLNAFVREHMLEKTDAQERIAELRNNFYNLTRAHAAIEMAEKQLAVLEPLMKDGQEYEKLLVRISEADRCAHVVPLYIAARKKTLLEAAITGAQQQLSEAQNRHLSLEQQLTYLNQQYNEVYAAVTNDAVGQRLKLLEQEMRTLAAEQRAKQDRASKYSTLTRKVGLPEYSDEATFNKTARRVKELLSEITQRMVSLTDRRDAEKQRETELKKSIRQFEDELRSLQQRKNQIPIEDILLRERLLKALNLTEEDVPLVGELLRVRDSAQRWEGAIERLLRGFGRQMLVPEQHYVKVSRYVDTTDLKGRLVYHRVSMQRTSSKLPVQDRDMLLSKIEVKPGTSFSEWLTAEIAEFYNYRCCETLEEFQQARRALTISGQIKHSVARHEKDDRYSLHDRKRYVLGWNNAEKLAAIQTELRELRKALHQVSDRIQSLQGNAS